MPLLRFHDAPPTRLGKPLARSRHFESRLDSNIHHVPVAAKCPSYTLLYEPNSDIRTVPDHTKLALALGYHLIVFPIFSPGMSIAGCTRVLRMTWLQ